MEKEPLFGIEREKIELLKQRWNDTLVEVAQKVYKTFDKELPQDVTAEKIPRLLEELTESRIRVKKDEANFLIISSSAGTGKTTIGEMLEELGINRLPRVTTREKRPNEREAEDYFFISREEFEKRRKKGDFLYHKETYGEGRAIAKDIFDKILSSKKKFYAEGDALAYSEIKKQPEYKNIEYQSIFLLPPIFDALVERMTKRIEKGFKQKEKEPSENELLERLEKAIFYLQRSGDHFSTGTYDGFLVNDDLKRVGEKLKDYI